jgi:hypothetical protein
MLGCQTATVEGPQGQKLTLITPTNVAIARGTSETFDVEVQRTNTDAAVTLTLDQLPDGVSARRPSQTIETDSAAFILQAEDDAALVSNHAVAVTIEGPGGMRGTEYVNLTVTP